MCLGDGAGILCSIPHEFFSEVLKLQSVTLPEVGEYFVGMVFFPKDEELREKCRRIIGEVATQRGHASMAWRTVPVNNYNLGNAALRTEPVVEQWFGTPNPDSTLETEVEVRTLFSGAELNEMC